MGEEAATTYLFRQLVAVQRVTVPRWWAPQTNVIVTFSIDYIDWLDIIYSIKIVDFSYTLLYTVQEAAAEITSESLTATYIIAWHLWYCSVIWLEIDYIHEAFCTSTQYT